jgi:hypothetical protein
MEDPYLRSIYSGDRRPYDPNLAPHPNAPRAQYYPAFSPGMLAGLRDQLAMGYGPQPNATPEEQAQQEYRMQADPEYAKMVEQNLKGIYKDTVATYVPQPITSVMSDFAKGAYQQYGQDSGSPFLNSLLGFAPGTPPAPGTGGTGQFAPGAGAAAAPAAAAPAPQQQQVPMAPNTRVPMNRDDAEQILRDQKEWEQMMARMQMGGR